MSATPELFRKAMRCLAGAVTIVATASEGTRAGLTATAVCSFSAQPARVLACVNLRGATYRAIAESRRMSVNVLARSQEPLARRFAGMEKAPAGSHFLESDWCTLVTGAPVLKGCLAGFDCGVEEMFIGKSHAIVFGEVKDVLLGPFEPPLVYLDGTFTTVELFNEQLWATS